MLSGEHYWLKDSEEMDLLKDSVFATFHSGHYYQLNCCFCKVISSAEHQLFGSAEAEIYPEHYIRLHWQEKSHMQQQGSFAVQRKYHGT